MLQTAMKTSMISNEKSIVKYSPKNHDDDAQVIKCILIVTWMFTVVKIDYNIFNVTELSPFSIKRQKVSEIQIVTTPCAFKGVIQMWQSRGSALLVLLTNKINFIWSVIQNNLPCICVVGCTVYGLKPWLSAARRKK